MTLDLWILVGLCFWALFHILWAGHTFTAMVGLQYNLSPRDENLARKGLAGRLYRAQVNFFETFPLMAFLVTISSFTEANSYFSFIGTSLYAGGRILYVFVYAAGIPYIRTFVWMAATAGIAIVAFELVLYHLT